MDFYIALTDEEIEFIKYVLTLSKNFVEQVFGNKAIFTKTVATSNGRCIYNVESTSDGPRICIRVTVHGRDRFITFPEDKEFSYQYYSCNPWTNEAVRIEILSEEEAMHRQKMEELKKLALLATHLREFVVNGETIYHSINQVRTSEVIDEDKIAVTSENDLTISIFMLSEIMKHPELYGFFTMIPTEAITEDIKNMLE
jgi:hypothetical protein